jgi:hypothetical protein
LNLRKHLLGIEDQDCCSNFGDDLNPDNYASTEKFEEDLVNHIDYMIGLIFKQSGSSYQTEVMEILIKGTSL